MQHQVKKTNEYRGFVGTIEYAIDDRCFYGKLLFTKDLVTYEAKTLETIQKSFENAIDNYVKTCWELERKHDFHVKRLTQLQEKTWYTQSLTGRPCVLLASDPADSFGAQIEGSYVWSLVADIDTDFLPTRLNAFDMLERLNAENWKVV